MKVCIPTAGVGGIDDFVGQHFGRVPTYTLVDLDTNKVEVIPNTSEHRGGVGVPPEFISKTGTHVMLLLRAGTESGSDVRRVRHRRLRWCRGHGARCDRGMAAGAAYGSNR